MIPGLNTNVEHERSTFHVQTEDHGPKVSIFVTQVFRAGQVVATSESPYSPDLSLGGRLRQQRVAHREAIEALLAGQFSEAP